MKILIMRHGEAQSRASSDAERPLTSLGMEQALSAGQSLSRIGFCPDRIWVSPYLRTQQTCEQILKSFSLSPECVTSNEFVPEASPTRALDVLFEQEDSTVMLVSHMPLVSSLVGLLVEGHGRYGPSMSPASMALVSGEVAGLGCFERVWLGHAPEFCEVF